MDKSNKDKPNAENEIDLISLPSDESDKEDNDNTKRSGDKWTLSEKILCKFLKENAVYVNDQLCNLKWQGICDLLVELGYPSRDKKAREARYRESLKDDNLESLQRKCNDFEKGKVLKFYSNQQKSYLLNEIKNASEIDQQFTDKFNKTFNDNRSRIALILLFNDYILNKPADSFESKEGEYEYDHWQTAFEELQTRSLNDVLSKYDLKKEEFKRLYINYKFSENLTYQCEYYECYFAGKTNDQLLIHLSTVHRPKENNSHLDQLLNCNLNDTLYDKVKDLFKDDENSKIKYSTYFIFDLNQLNEFKFGLLNSSDIYFGRTSVFDIRGTEHQFAASLNKSLNKCSFKDLRLLSINVPVIMEIENGLTSKQSKLSEFLCIELPFDNKINQIKGTLPATNLSEEELKEYQVHLLKKMKSNFKATNVYKIDKSKIGKACNQLLSSLDPAVHKNKIDNLPKHPDAYGYYDLFMLSMFSYLKVDEAEPMDAIMNLNDDLQPNLSENKNQLSDKGIAYHYHCPYCHLRFKFSSSCKVHMFGNKDLGPTCKEIKNSLSLDAEPIKGNGNECLMCSNATSLNKKTSNLIDSLQASGGKFNLTVDKENADKLAKPIGSSSGYARNFSYHCPYCSHLFKSKHQCKRHMGLAERQCSCLFKKDSSNLDPALCVGDNCTHCLKRK